MKQALFLLMTLSFGALSLPAYAATFYFYPQHLELPAGEDAFVDLYVDTAGESINALEVEGDISSVNATIRSIDTSNSVFEIFAERPSVSNNSSFRIAAGIPSGFSGQGIVARLLVRGELEGSAALAVKPLQSQLLRADGTADAVAFTVTAAEVQVISKSPDYVTLSSQSHPSQTQWYKAKEAALHWDLKPDIQYSYLVSRDPLAEPDDSADKPEGDRMWVGDVKLNNLEEGVLYFTVKQVRSDVVARYRLLTDRTDPMWVTTEINAGTPETENRPFLTLFAKDAVSGVEYYEVKVDGGEPIEVSSLYVLPESYRVLTARAYDFAGNVTEYTFTGTEPLVPVWVWLILLALILAKAFGILKRRKREA